MAGVDDPLDRPTGEAWHPEPELLDVRDEATSRPALEKLGEAAWSAALDYVYEHGQARAIGEPGDYEELRRVFFGPSGRPGPAPTEPTTSQALIEEFRTRLAPHQANAWHPRAYAYFTPIPLWASITGELFSQVVHQGVDVWHCSPSATLSPNRDGLNTSRVAHRERVPTARIRQPSTTKMMVVVFDMISTPF